MIETYDIIIARPECAFGISDMGKDNKPVWREANPGNGATASIPGELVSPPEGMGDLGVPNTGFKYCDRLTIQMTGMRRRLKIDLNRKCHGKPFIG